MKISIVVPVYNTEQYLPRCIDSILSQGFTDFELLLIDDGSTDGSGVICDAYADKDNRVRVFHKENGGVSSARNLGIDNARGEWLFFVDSDDALCSEGLQVLVDGISEDVDVVMGGYERYDEKGHLLEALSECEECVFSKSESLMSLYHGYSLYYKYIGYTWLRLFRNSIISQNNIRFDTELRIKEDTLFVTQYLCKSNGVTRFIPLPVYKYYYREDCAMGGWRRGFDYKYVDSFYALIKMKREIESVYSKYGKLVYVAKEGVVLRYYKIIKKLKKAGTSDAALCEKLKIDLSNELDVWFRIQYRIKNRRNNKNQKRNAAN